MTAGGRRAIGLDVGEARIGVAVSDEGYVIASPVEAVRRSPQDLDALRQAVARWNAETVVVGLPRGMSGREGPQAATVRAFAAKLADALGPAVAVEFWDERLSSVAAERSMRASGAKPSRDRKSGELDAVAAAVILQGWLDAARFRRRQTEPPR